MLKNIIKLKNLNLFHRYTRPTPVSVLPGLLRYMSTEQNLHSNNEAKKTNPFLEKKPDVLDQVPDNDTKLKILELEVDIAAQEGRRIPDVGFLKEQQWNHLLTLPSKSARMKYLAYLWTIEKKRENEKAKKVERQIALVERRAKEKELAKTENHIIYGINHNTMFLRIYDSTITKFYNYRLIRAMIEAPKIVVDCSYDQYMTSREALNAAKQLMLCFAENRIHDEPFDLHYCNVNLESTCFQGLKRFIPTILDVDFPMYVHQKCFTQIFPKDKLVYLTPHCRTDLVEYNPDDIYIVGAMVDKVNNEPLSLAKAKRLGLRMARLPLDKYLQWGSGSGKSLTINQMINILLDIRSTGDWNAALKHVPRRKVVDVGVEKEKQRKTIRRHAEKLKFNLDTWTKT